MSLQSILDAFKGPVNEEQTWAICFQVIKHVQDKCVQNGSQGNSSQAANSVQDTINCNDNLMLPRLNDPSQIILHSDGSVSLDTIKSKSNSHHLDTVTEKEVNLILNQPIQV